MKGMLQSRMLFAVIAFTLAGAALGQTPGLGETRPAPDNDAAKQDPAVKEREATPSRTERSQSDAAISRCKELFGEPREQCLREERSAAAGATRRAEPPTAPPPQNPR